MSVQDLPHPRRLAVIIGAGASHDCAREGVNELSNDYRPPLVQELFEFRPAFNAILRKYPKAEDLSPTIRTKVKKGAYLETYLKDLASEEKLVFRKQYWQVPLYLQDLLGEVSAHYVRSGGTKFDELVRSIEKSPYDQVMYVTLNYDLFLERALEGLYDVTFSSMDHYCQDKRGWWLVKLHGSVNWGQRVTNRPQGGDNNSLLLLNRMESDLKLEKEITVLQGYQENSRFDGEHFYYPTLAVPLEAKAFYSCPQGFVDQIVEYFALCSDYLFIGFSGRDQHVLQLLTKVPRVRKFSVVCGSQRGADSLFGSLASVNQQFNGQHLVPDYRNVITMGFFEFVATDHLDSFLRA